MTSRAIWASPTPPTTVPDCLDQEFGEGATLRVAPELADPVDTVEVEEHEDVEQLGAGSTPGASRPRVQGGTCSIGSPNIDTAPPHELRYVAFAPMRHPHQDETARSGSCLAGAGIGKMGLVLGLKGR